MFFSFCNEFYILARDSSRTLLLMLNYDLVPITKKGAYNIFKLIKFNNC